MKEEIYGLAKRQKNTPQGANVAFFDLVLCKINKNELDISMFRGVKKTKNLLQNGEI